MTKKRSALWPRLRWHLYRTPAASVIKAIRRALRQRQVRRRKQMAAAVPTTALQERLARQINEFGYAVVTEAVDQASLDALARAASPLHARALSRDVSQESSHKDYWTRLLDEEMHEGALRANNPFAAFALQPAVIGILSRVYGELPRLDYVLLTLSRDTGKPLAYSQLWHRDHDDTRVIKLFVYLTNVDSLEDGPLTFITGPASDRFGFTMRSHQSDVLVNGKVQSDDVKSMVAPALSVFIVETSRCLHMGSRLAPGHERLLYTATFISVPRLYPEPAPRFLLEGSESDVVRSVLLPE